MRSASGIGQHWFAKKDDEFLWLVSLSDLMILLFIFFCVIASFTLKRATRSDFQKMREVFSGDKPQEITPVDEIQKKLLAWVVDKKLIDTVNVVQKDDMLILEIREKLLFNAGAWDILPASREVLEYLGMALEKVPAPYRIGIEGHTDDNPIGIIDGKVRKRDLLRSSGKIIDNWDLSVRRAHTVFSALRLKPDQISRAVLMGYGSERPLIPNRTEDGKPIPENQAKNRRVTIRVF